MDAAIQGQHTLLRCTTPRFGCRFGCQFGCPEDPRRRRTMMSLMDIVESREDYLTAGQSDVDSPIDLKDFLTEQARLCNQSYSEHYDGLFCPQVFDGWSCWNATPAGSTAFGLCPSFVTGFQSQRFAHKRCMEDGTWFRHPESNTTWSNYTTCVDLDDLQARQAIINLYVSGYSVSLVALVISFIIFCKYRSLKCTRIVIHRNLFASFIVHNALWLVWYKAIVEQPVVLVENALSCRLLHIVLHYFLVSNYFWMFCEGLYLHTLLMVTFIAEEALLKWFYLIGWLIPAVFTAVYALVRSSVPSEDQHCWIDESKSTWVLSAPVCLSILINGVFLVNIVRILLTKLKAPATPGTQERSACRTALVTISAPHSNVETILPTNASTTSPGNKKSAGRKLFRIKRLANNLSRNNVSYRARSTSSITNLWKAVRATLVLLPLLGLHYIITPFRPETGSPAEIVYQFVSAVVTSFQGLCVAFLYCFCNGEVLRVFRKTCRRYAISTRPLVTSHKQFSTKMTTEL